MSVENVHKFIKRMDDDEDFREKVGRAKDKAERMKIVQDAGFDFTLDELKSVMGEIPKTVLTAENKCCPEGGGLWHVEHTCQQTHQEHCTPASEGQCGCGDSL